MSGLFISVVYNSSYQTQNKHCFNQQTLINYSSIFIALSALSVGMDSKPSKYQHSCLDARSKKQLVTDDQHLTQTEPFLFNSKEGGIVMETMHARQHDVGRLVQTL